MKPIVPIVDTRKIAAFTLIELMVTLAIAAILLGIGLPSFRDTIQKQRLASVVNEFFTSIHLVRSEALQRGTRVDMVPADGVDWATGWIIFVDENANRSPDGKEQVIFSRGPVFEGLQIKSAFTDSSRQYLAYNGNGRTRTNGSGETPQLGTVSFFLDKQIRRIKLNFVGRPRTCNPEQDATCTGAGDSS